MKNKGTIKKILIGLFVAIVLLGVFAAVTSNNSDVQGNSSLSSLIGQGNLGQVQETDSALANAEILRILGSIENISLDDDIFTNPVFRELEDSRFTIPKPTRIGRPNPFLPIGFDGFTGSSTQNQSTLTQEQESQNFFNQVSDSQSNGFINSDTNFITENQGSNFFNETPTI